MFLGDTASPSLMKAVSTPSLRRHIETTDALINRGGALASEGDVDIAAGALFANLSGTVSGAGV